MFPDDTAQVADSEGRLRQLVEEFGRMCQRRKLKVNGSKSKVMKCTRLVSNGQRMNVALNGKVLEEVECFEYLGSHVDVNGGKVCGGMKRVFKCKSLHMSAEKAVQGSSGTSRAIWG